MDQSPNSQFNPQTRPVNLTIDRAAGILQITWRDGVASDYPLAWLRENCPCATCNEKRQASQDGTDDGLLTLNIRPSYEVTDAALVGNYAIQPTWGDGHDTGFYAYAFLRGAWDQGGVSAG